MKKAFLLFGIIAISITANAQKLNEKDVPETVKAKFKSSCPAVKKASWEKENGNYQAEYMENKIETEVVIDANGNLVATEVSIPVSALPKDVSEYASKNMAGKTIDEASRITAANGAVTYEAEIGGNDYLFDASGNFLRQEIEPKETEDNDKK